MNKFWGWLVNFFSAIGAINWGLVAFFKFNLIDYINMLSGNVGFDMFLYLVIAISGFFSFLSLFGL